MDENAMGWMDGVDGWQRAGCKGIPSHTKPYRAIRTAIQAMDTRAAHTVFAIHTSEANGKKAEAQRQRHKGQGTDRQPGRASQGPALGIFWPILALHIISQSAHIARARRCHGPHRRRNPTALLPMPRAANTHAADDGGALCHAFPTCPHACVSVCACVWGWTCRGEMDGCASVRGCGWGWVWWARDFLIYSSIYPPRLYLLCYLFAIYRYCSTDAGLGFEIWDSGFRRWILEFEGGDW